MNWQPSILRPEGKKIHEKELQLVTHPSMQCVCQTSFARAMCWFRFPLCTHIPSLSLPLCLQVQQDAGRTACVWTAAPAGPPSASNCGLWWVLIKLLAVPVIWPTVYTVHNCRESCSQTTFDQSLSCLTCRDGSYEYFLILFDFIQFRL